MKNVFTTGQVAKICKVSMHTVHNWVDSGRLKGYLLPPNKKSRRIPRLNLIKFLKDNGMPLGDLEKEFYKILFIEVKNEYIDQLRQHLCKGRDVRCEVALEQNARVRIAVFRPDAIIVDLACNREKVLRMIGALRQNPRYENIPIIALVDEQESELYRLFLLAFGLSAVCTCSNVASLADCLSQCAEEKCETG